MRSSTWACAQSSLSKHEGPSSSGHGCLGVCGNGGTKTRAGEAASVHIGGPENAGTAYDFPATLSLRPRRKLCMWRKVVDLQTVAETPRVFSVFPLLEPTCWEPSRALYLEIDAVVEDAQVWSAESHEMGLRQLKLMTSVNVLVWKKTP